MIFITMSVSMRWEHKFEVCSGDLIPKDYYKQMEQYEYLVPEFYFIETGFFMRIYSLAYVAAFALLTVTGLCTTFFVTYRTIIKNDRGPSDIPLHELELDNEVVPFG